MTSKYKKVRIKSYFSVFTVVLKIPRNSADIIQIANTSGQLKVTATPQIVVIPIALSAQQRIQIKPASIKKLKAPQRIMIRIAVIIFLFSFPFVIIIYQIFGKKSIPNLDVPRLNTFF